MNFWFVVEQFIALRNGDKSPYYELNSFGGIAVYNIGRQKSEKNVPFPDSLKKQKVTDFAFDGQNAWVGTRDGLYRYNMQTKRWRRFTDADGLSSNHISTLTVDVADGSNPALWVGAADEGASRYDLRTGKWETFTMKDGLSDHNIRDIVVVRC